MGFGLQLGCPEGHAALLQLQEAELRLLEGLKKWMGQRAKSDREYVALLHQMHSLAGKQESGGHLGSSKVSQVGTWGAGGSSPEGWARGGWRAAPLPSCQQAHGGAHRSGPQGAGLWL